MRRLVVALTALLATGGLAVAVGYLVLFSATSDRAARAVPADTAVYLKVYLQPSTGQKMNLFGLIGRVPGFRDAAALDEKLQEVAQRLLGDLGLDYEANLRPWLGTELALAVAAPREANAAPVLLLLATVKDPALARSAVPRLMARDGVTYQKGSYRGRATMMSGGLSYALLEDLLVVADSPDRLRAALDADADAAPSLADSSAFGTSMRTVPADHLASLFVDLGRVAPAGARGRLGGYGTATLALTAEPDGLHLDGSAPFSADAASDLARTAHALGTHRSSLATWMPRSTRVELGAFGLQQSLLDLEAQIGADPAFAPAVDALNQLRAITAVGLGINADRDLLPLFDGEAALALTNLDPAAPHGVLLLRPSHSVAVQAALDRMLAALVERGSSATTSQAQGATIHSVTVPQVGHIAYALVDGVVLAGIDPDDVAAALTAHANGQTLDTGGGYRPGFVLLGAHAGNELWADIPRLVDAASGIFDPGSELRDILHQIGVLAMSASTADDRLEVHAVLTVK